MHTAPEFNTTGQPGGLGEYDGCAVFEVPSLEVFDNAFKDEYYVKTIAPDELNFVDTKVVMWTRGRVKKIL